MLLVSTKGEHLMKKVYLSLLSFASLSLLNHAYAADKAEVPVTTPQASTASTPSSFTPTQLTELEKVIGDYLTKHPDVIMNSFQAAMTAQQKEATEKMEKAVAANKDKIFKDKNAPVGGNPTGSQTLVVFLDPYCGYCKKFHAELITLLNTNKDVKVIYKDLPIMGPASVMTIKAMLAAKEQGKYDQLQKAVFESDKHLTKKQLLKLASSLGIDTKKLEADMKKKEIQAEVDQTQALAKEIGINGTPTLIVGETKVIPGFVAADELNKMLKESVSGVAPTAENKPVETNKAS
jgi:protein-disulfide isomerase